MIIGLTGYARSGKDTVAAILNDLAGYERRAFADPLKKIALACDPLIPTTAADHVRLSHYVAALGWEDAKANPEVRRFLQALGTEGVRENLGDDAWIRAWELTLTPGRRYAVTDVRFPNEAHAIKATGGVVWRIYRPGVEPPNKHASELLVDEIPIDETIINDGTLDDLREAVREALAEQETKYLESRKLTRDDLRAQDNGFPG